MKTFFLYKGSQYCGSVRSGQSSKEVAEQFAKDQGWPKDSVRATTTPPGLDKKVQSYSVKGAVERLRVTAEYLPQEAVGKSAAAIAKIMEPHLKKVGIDLDKPAPFKDDKAAIYSVKSSKIKPGETAYIWFHAKARGGRGINKERNLSAGFGVRNEAGENVSRAYVHNGLPLLFIAAISYEDLGGLYEDYLK